VVVVNTGAFHHITVNTGLQTCSIM